MKVDFEDSNKKFMTKFFHKNPVETKEGLPCDF